MNIVLFFFTYILGFIPLYIDEKDYVLYLLSIMLYIGIASTFKKINIKQAVLMPLMLSFSAVLVLSIYLGKGMTYTVLVISTFVYFYFYHQRIGRMETQETSIEFIRHLILSIIAPIALFLILNMMVTDQVMSMSLFIMMYSAVLLITNIKRKHMQYGIFIIIQLLILVYLSHFAHSLTAVEQLILLINVVVFGLMKWMHK